MKAVKVWVLAQWAIPEEMWEAEGDSIMSVMDSDVKFAMASLSSLDCGPVALKTRVQKPGEQEDAAPSAEAKVVHKATTPDEYRERTGKRFRMTKEQKERGLSRDEAFKEFIANE
tara:strand:+ start:283 stop:627 length:345 start_codon:yes stop_codon:yes gene_type:complete